MKLLLLFTFLSVAPATDGVVPPLQYQLHIPDKCEDVLAVKVCDRLRKTATALKLKSEEVKNAVLDAYQKGLATTNEIAEAAEDFLVNKVMTKKCEDFTSAEVSCYYVQLSLPRAPLTLESVFTFIHFLCISTSKVIFIIRMIFTTDFQLYDFEWLVSVVFDTVIEPEWLACTWMINPTFPSTHLSELFVSFLELPKAPWLGCQS